jgi:hypothetical protein
MITDLLASIDFDSLYTAGITIAGAITAVIAFFEKTEKEKTQAFFDPDNDKQMTPPAGTPDRSWKMADSVKSFLLSGHTDAEKADILKQIDAAEKAGLVDYQISHPNGYYNISYGQINGGASWGK